MVRLPTVLLAAATACGRLGFDAAERTDDGGPPDGGPPEDVMPSPVPGLGCGETVTAQGAPITGSALEAVVTTGGLAVLWIGPGGALRGTTWSAAGGGVAVEKDGVMIAPGPFRQLWVAANDDEILVAAQDVAGVTGRFLHEDLTPSRGDVAFGTAPPGGRQPFTRQRGGTGFVGITVAGDQLGVFPIPQTTPGVVHLLTDLAFHSLPSIAADSDGYAVVSELADQYGPGCWYSKVNDSFVLVSGPGSLESTQQADCDTSTVVTSAGAGAAMAWMDRDPVNSYAEFRGTAGGSGVASMPGEVGVTLPTVAVTSTGFAALYRAAAGIRVFDAGGTRTLAPSNALADLVTWADRAIVVWTTPSGMPQLTRLCPALSRSRSNEATGR